MTGDDPLIQSDDDVPVAMIEAARKLHITPVEADELHVDASELLPEDDNGVRYWRLHWEGDEWHHWPSGTHGTLGEQIIGIASCYVARSVVRDA